MKKLFLLSLMMTLAVGVAFAQDEEEAEIEELDEPPSLDELLERPKPCKVKTVDDFTNAAFDLYDKVIQVRKDGETNGWPEQGIKVAKFGKEGLKLVKASVLMAKDIKKVPKLKIPAATIRFVQSKKAISHSLAHVKYMKTQYSEEEMAQFEMQVEAEEGAEEETGDGDDGK